jgi:aminoglycoside phosphotransferase (APT) family kinase protein
MFPLRRKFGRKAKAIRGILGEGTRIARVTDLHRTRRGRTLLVELEGEPGRVVLKRCREPAGCLREVRNLAAINRVVEAHTPRYLGEWENYFVEEFVDGEPAPRILESRDAQRAARCCEAVVRNLAAIHAGRETAAKTVDLDARFTRERVERRVRSCWERIEGVGFPAYERRCGSVPEAWRRVFSENLVTRLVRDVAASGDEAVLGHGEYHGDHLILASSGDAYAVDWGTMALASPWYDLAYPLLMAPSGDRRAIVAGYLEPMQQRGHLRGISQRRADELAASGILYHELIEAQRTANRLRARGEARWGDRFRGILDSLVA